MHKICIVLIIHVPGSLIFFLWAYDKTMATASDAVFNDVFKRRFEDLSRLSSLYDSPASSDLSFVVAEPSASALPSSAKAVSQQPSCTSCETLARPLPCAEPGKGMLSGGTSWLLGLLLVVGVFLVIFGIYQLFRSSSERNRKPVLFPNLQLPNRLHGAVHMPSTPSTGIGFGPLAGSGGNGIEENDPDSIIPDENDNGVTIVFFHATWCGHCKQFKPIFEEAADAHGAKAKFKSVVSDVLQKSKHASKVPIQGFPTVFVFKNGQQVDSMVGNQGKDALLELIAKHTA
uniref:Thioredoxin domain-containing protein n=1 Tax=viral metagenome TaxID=1070528 RepID=A0A6C0BZX5_9ZZZZ